MSSKLARRLLVLLVAAGALPACGNINDGHPPVPFTVRASVDTFGAEANQASELARVSGNGRYVVFVSSANNLVAGDTNGKRDVFRRDLATGITELVSVGFGGAPGDEDSDNPSISDDGRYVAFDSFATNLLAAPESLRQVYVRDMNNTSGNGVSLVSVDPLGFSGDDESSRPAISGDGAFVAFESFATTLAGNHPDLISNIYRRELATSSILQVSLNTGGGEPTAGPGAVPDSITCAISRDGTRIAFLSGCTDLVIGDTNNLADVFAATVDALGAVTIVRASMATVPAGANAASDKPSISADGRFVAFESRATNLVVPDANSTAFDVYVFNVDVPGVERVSLNSAGLQAAQFESQAPSLSEDGRFVAFQSLAINLVEGDTNQAMDIFIRDRLTGMTVRVSVDSSGNQAGFSQNSTAPSISADGRAVAFRTVAPFVNGDTNGLADIYVRSPLR